MQIDMTEYAERIDKLGVRQLEELQRMVENRLSALRFANLPRVIVQGDDVRPRYLNGATGRMGGWVSARRRRFYPDAGTEARARGPEWRVDAGLLKPLA